MVELLGSMSCSGERGKNSENDYILNFRFLTMHSFQIFIQKIKFHLRPEIFINLNISG